MLTRTDKSVSESVVANAGRHRISWSEFLIRYGLLLLLLAMVAFFALSPETSQTFAAVSNIRTLIGNQAVTAILALAAIVPLIAGEFDVSIGATLGMACMVTAKLLVEHHSPILLAAAVGIGIGAVIGSVIGVLVAYLRVSSFVISLGMSTLIGGLVTWYSKAETIVGIPQGLADFGNKNLLGVPRPVWLLLVVAAALAIVLRYTIFGRNLLATGVNRRAAQLVGVRTSQRVAAAFVISGTLAGLAGVTQLARTGAASPQIGTGFMLAALAAAFLGATTITPGRFNVPGTIVGVLFVGVAVNGFTILGVADWVEPAFNGAAVVVAVSAAAFISHRRKV